MKNPYLPVTLALLVGVGIGWLIKPSNPFVPANPPVSRETRIERPKPDIAASERQSDAAVSDEVRTKSSVRTTVSGSSFEISGEQRDAQEKMATAMTESQRKKDERQIAEHVEKLGLDAGQEAKLRAFYEKRREAITGMFSGGTSMPDFKALGDEPMDNLMAEMLSEEQGKAYSDHKAAERDKKVESRALKDLAKLNGVIDIRPEQKDAIYQVLFEDAGGKVDRAAKSGMDGMVSMMGGGFGGEMDLEAFGLPDSLDLSELEAGSGGDHAAVLERFRADQKAKTDLQVKRMEPVLDAKQLEAYREHLEAKGSIFQSMIHGDE